jgi:hypothetical protein
MESPQEKTQSPVRKAGKIPAGQETGFGFGALMQIEWASVEE